MTSTKLPTVRVRNAIAFVDAYGRFPSHLHFNTRWEAEKHGVERNENLCVKGDYRMFLVTHEGRALAATSPLAKCLTWLAARGWRIDTNRRRTPRPNFITIVNDALNAEGFISGGARVYLPTDGQKWQTQLAFDATSRRAKESAQ